MNIHIRPQPDEEAWNTARAAAEQAMTDAVAGPAYRPLMADAIMVLLRGEASMHDIADIRQIAEDDSPEPYARFVLQEARDKGTLGTLPTTRDRDEWLARGLQAAAVSILGWYQANGWS